ncbi:MAG: YncE family protein, partial [Ilumatobacteraceae bacterium]
MEPSRTTLVQPRRHVRRPAERQRGRRDRRRDEGRQDARLLRLRQGSVGFVDITDPAAPAPAGTVAVGGSPTSVAVGSKYALVAVDTSDDGDGNSDDDFLSPSGTLHVIDVGTRQIVKTFQLGGQPDSVALSPDGKYAAIVLENQRNEDLNDGALPQL